MSLMLAPRPSVPTPPPATRRPRRRWPAVATAASGGGLLAGAVVWWTAAVPALVKFPTDVDQTLAYTGTFLLHADPQTRVPLDDPLELDLTVERHVEALEGESGAGRVVLRETITETVAGLDGAVQVRQYVMDRRTNANVDDPRSWAFDESNRLDRAGAFWLAMPRDVDSSSVVDVFKDEIAATYPARGSDLTERVGGLELVGLEASLPTPQPLTEAYLRTLDAVVPLPRSLTFDEMRPQLVAAGLPVDEAVAALGDAASPDDLAALGALIGEPIPMEYVLTLSGETFVEPRTGAIVDVASVVNIVGARPTAEAVAPLLAILERYADDPAVADVVAGLESIGSSDPIPVFELRYGQTRSSVVEVADYVADQVSLKTLAERTIPITAATVGGLLAVVGGALQSRRRAAARGSAT